MSPVVTRNNLKTLRRAAGYNNSMSAPDSGGPAASYRALLGVAESAADAADPPELLRQIAARLRAVVPFDFLGVLLHDAATDVLRLTVFVASEDPDAPPRCLRVRPNEAPSGAVWQTQEPMLVPDLSV